MVVVSVKPTEDEVVDEGQKPGRRDSIVRSNVGHDGHFGSNWHGRGDEIAEELGEWAASWPVSERMEDEFAASVGVLFPSSQLVVDGERDAFLEAISGVRGITKDIPLGLKAKGHVEIFRHSDLGPVLFWVTVLTAVSDVLNCRPAKNSIVANERRDIAVCNCKRDGGVDKIREEGDAAFEESVGNVHDTGLELNDGNLRRLLHFAYSIQEAVLGHTGIGVDDQNVVADSNVAISPSPALVLFHDLLQAAHVSIGLVFLSPCTRSVNLGELVLDPSAHRHGIVHVRSLLEFASSYEGGRSVFGFGIVLRSSDPSDVMFIIKVFALLALLFRNQLHAIIVDKNVGSAALHLIGRDGSLDRLDGRLDDGAKTLLVDGSLDGDMRQRTLPDPRRTLSRVEF